MEDYSESLLVSVIEAIPAMVWMTSADGRLQFFNRHWRNYAGTEAACDFDQCWTLRSHPADARRAATEFRASLSSGRPCLVEHRIRRYDGEYRWHLTRAEALCDPAGNVVRWLGVSTDIHEQRLAFEREYTVAHSFETAALPHVPGHIDGIEFDSIYAPSGTDAIVGGDWFDAIDLPDGRIVLCIGDVLGCGNLASVAMWSARQIVRSLAQVCRDPVAMLDAADRAIRAEDYERYITAFIAMYDRHTSVLTFANAGHPTPLLRSPEGILTELRADGLPLGLRENMSFSARSVSIAPGSQLVLYTDGLIESTHDYVVGFRKLVSAMFDTELMQGPSPARALYERVLCGEVRDDVAILVMTLEPHKRYGPKVTLAGAGSRSR